MVMGNCCDHIRNDCWGVLALRIHFSRPLLVGILPEIFVGVWIFMIGVPNQLVATLLVAFATGISLEIFMSLGVHLCNNIFRANHIRE